MLQVVKNKYAKQLKNILPRQRVKVEEVKVEGKNHMKKAEGTVEAGWAGQMWL